MRDGIRQRGTGRQADSNPPAPEAERRKMSERVDDIIRKAHLAEQRRENEILEIALQMAVDKLHACGWHDGGVQYFKQMADMHYYSSRQSKKDLDALGATREGR